jgi:hypothetical protein
VRFRAPLTAAVLGTTVLSSNRVKISRGNLANNEDRILLPLPLEQNTFAFIAWKLFQTRWNLKTMEVADPEYCFLAGTS